MTTIETLMDSLKNCRKAISQTIPFSRQDDLLKSIEADIMADIRQRWMDDCGKENFEQN
jgi:hypothetical protein